MISITRINTFCLCNNKVNPYNRSCDSCKTLRYSLYHECKRQESFNLDSNDTWVYRIEQTHHIMQNHHSKVVTTMPHIVASRTRRSIELISAIESGLAKEFLLKVRGNNA